MFNPLHPWHAVSPGDQAPQIVNGIIEISKGSKVKYELDKETALLRVDRVLFSSVHYPTNYGFIPKTFCGDKDPLDILVISSEAFQPLCMAKAKVIGVMRMFDNDEVDDKIIAVALHDMSVNHINDISELPPHTENEIMRFFQDYKILEKRKIEVEHFLGKEKAYEIIKENFEMYKKMFPTK
jgi:inorganic pyrophosphatase